MLLPSATDRFLAFLDFKGMRSHTSISGSRVVNFIAVPPPAVEYSSSSLGLPTETVTADLDIQPLLHGYASGVISIKVRSLSLPLTRSRVSISFRRSLDDNH
jgi:hypothetical protein